MEGVPDHKIVIGDGLLGPMFSDGWSNVVIVSMKIDKLIDLIS